MAYGRLIKDPIAATELVPLFKHQLAHSNLKAGELCIVVTDTSFNPVYAAASMGAALDMGAEAYLMTLPHSRAIPSKSLGAAWEEADLLIYHTPHILHYSDDMARGLARGLRAMMAVQPLHVLQRLKADPDVVRRTRAAAKLLNAADEIRITSPHGTDLTMRKGDRPGFANCGVADTPGKIDFWGGAIVETAQLEGTTEGTLVMNTGDIIFHLGRFIDDPVTITFEKGRVVEIAGKLDAFLLRKFLHSFNDPNALMAGHTSFGTDRRAQWYAQAVQFPEGGAGGSDTEAFYGNVQIEIGSNCDLNFRGKIQSKAHLGLCMLEHSLYLDGKAIIEGGEFVPEELRAAPLVL
jgi:2,5-dihydroxypyridine 5,6-dioxygenase